MSSVERILKIGSILLILSQAFGELPMDEADLKDYAMFNSVYHYLEDCVQEDNVNVGNCLDMFRGVKLDDSTYTPCKCLIPCLAKKMDVYNSDGTYNFGRIRDIVNRIESAYFRKEAKRVIDICETEPGTDCEGGFNIINCAIQHSHVAARSVRLSMESLDDKFSHSSKEKKENNLSGIPDIKEGSEPAMEVSPTP